MFRFFMSALLASFLILAPVAPARAQQLSGNYDAQRVAQFTISAAADANTTNATNITFVAKNVYGSPIPFASFTVYLADTTNGLGLTAITASGSAGTLAVTGIIGGCDTTRSTPFVQGDFTSGSCLGVLTAKKSFQVMANASGQYILYVLDSLKSPFVPCAQAAGFTGCGAALVSGSYHP